MGRKAGALKKSAARRPRIIEVEMDDQRQQACTPVDPETPAVPR